jgi:sugar/nucleoside kinase (ribokinase family)
MSSIVTLGVHIVDILGRHIERIPSGQNIDLIDEIRMTVAGTAAGTAVDLAKLGVDVVTMGAIGQDELGNFIVNTMQHYGIRTDSLVRKPGVQTSATLLPIRPNGERPALHVLGCNAHLSIEDVDWDAIKAADYLHFGGTYLLPKLDGAPMAEILRFAKAHDTVTSVDILAVPRDDMFSVIEPSLPYIDYFMPGIEEAAMIAGLPVEQTNDIVRFFLDKGLSHAVFTMGARGSIVAAHNSDDWVRVPAFRAHVVDSTGCGDAYCAGFLVGLSKGWDIATCARFGSAAAALVITGLGSDAGIVDFESTLRFMQTAETLPLE